MDKHEPEAMGDQGMAAWSNHDPDAWAHMFADDFVARVHRRIRSSALRHPARPRRRRCMTRR